MLSIKNTKGVAFVELNAPPVNALGLSMRQELRAAINQLEKDNEVEAIVLCSALLLFCGGADIAEFRTEALWEMPDLPSLCEKIESSNKPFIIAMAGAAMGGALEIALACDYRIATSNTLMGLPEIKLGLLPGAGGTQRLPRIAGLEVATQMILSGDPVNGDYALSCGLVDEIFENDDAFLSNVLAFAHEVVSKENPKRRCDDIKVSHIPISTDFLHTIFEIKYYQKSQASSCATTLPSITSTSVRATSCRGLGTRESRVC